MTTLPVLRASFEATGSGRWLMQTIVDQAFDQANGFRLDIALSDDGVQGGMQATEARLLAGEVDFIDTDWLSIARCRRDGFGVTGAVPYGAIYGGLVAPDDGSVRSLEDLPGKSIGVVRRLDKNWLLLRAVCRRMHGFDPQIDCHMVEAGSKTALLEQLRAGEVDAALLFWHQIPALLAEGGFIEVCDMLDMLPLLGVRDVPSTFFVFRDDLVKYSPELIRGFARALRDAHKMLSERPAAWQAAAGVEGEECNLLRDKWLSRIKTEWQPDMEQDLNMLAFHLGDMQPETKFHALPQGTLSAALLLNQALSEA